MSTFKSGHRKTVADAKRDVCLKACKILYEMGELDQEHLLPKPLGVEGDVQNGVEDDEDMDDEDLDRVDESVEEYDGNTNLMIFPYTVSKQF